MKIIFMFTATVFFLYSSIEDSSSSCSCFDFISLVYNKRHILIIFL